MYKPAINYKSIVEVKQDHMSIVSLSEVNQGLYVNQD